VYDCLYPWTHGGAERWYRTLAEDLVSRGHEVTYLTRRQWDGEEPAIPGVRVVAVSPGGPLYDGSGPRRIVPPLQFGAGVLRYLARNRRTFDVVHLCAFPYFSLLAARAALTGTRVAIGVDWFEYWSDNYWRTYLGRFGGTLGSLVQQICARLTPRAFTYSGVTAARLDRIRGRRRSVRLTGLYQGSDSVEPSCAPPVVPTVVYAGRHIPEKRVHLIPPAVLAARARVEGLRATIFGDGPERERVRTEIDAAGLADVVAMPGFVPEAELEAGIRGATCLLLPSSREGYGLIQIEAAAFGTPAVVVAGEDNAATELIEPGVNGYVAASDSPEVIADAIIAVHEGGASLRESTARWFAANSSRLSASTSADTLINSYPGA